MKAALTAAWLLLVRVPFDFQAGPAHLPPGEYRLAIDGDAGSLTIRDAVIKIRRSTGRDRAPMSVVAFRAYGDRRFLGALEIERGDRWEIAPSTDEETLTRTSGQRKITTLKAETVPAR